jgi:sirohydrochlorin cobaltochelatase
MAASIVLAVHGSPPLDYPQAALMELMGLHARLQRAEGPERSALRARYELLDARIRQWPRGEANDPFRAGSLAIARELERASGLPVFLGFNEFCAPTVEEALETALQAGSPIVVLTPMLTRGGEHAEADIPAAISRARARHPRAEIRYAWPFAPDAVAGFLHGQLRHCLEGSAG